MEKQRDKQVSWHIYGGAAALTAIAFIAGIIFAYVGLNWRLSIVQNKVTDLFITMLSYQHAAELTNPCENQQYVWYLGKELDVIGERLSQGEYPEYLLKEYVLMESLHSRMIGRMRKECNRDVHWILFFYDKGCVECDAQGNILTRIKAENPKKVYVYAMRLSLESPIIRAYASEYNVSRVPTLIIDGKKYEGVVGYAEIKNMLRATGR